MDWNNISAELSKPLDSNHVKPAQQYGPKGDYIESWWAISEANRIFGFNGWNSEVVETSCVMQVEREVGKKKDPGFGVTYTAKVRVTVGDVVREDFGAGHGYDRDLGLAHESAIKEAISDAEKRALRKFGNPFGLALYDKTKANVVDADHINRVSDSNVKLEAATTPAELERARREVVAMWEGNPPADVVATFKSQLAKLTQEKDAA